MHPHRWFFKGLGLHTRLGDDVSRELYRHGRVERWGHRARIYDSADPTDVVLVWEGGVACDDGVRLKRAVLKRGDVFGTLDTQGPGDDTPGSEALDQTTLVTVPREFFDERVTSPLGDSTMTWGRIRRRSLDVPLHALLYTSPPARLAKALLHWAQTRGTPALADSATLELALTSARLASALGLDRLRAERAIRLLDQWGLLRREGRLWILHDLDGLRDAANR